MTIWAWIVFFVLISVVLALDLGILRKESKEISAKEAFAWTTVWTMLALLFNVGIYFIYENGLMGLGAAPGEGLSGKDAALQFLTGYIIEESLSMDNIFVIAMVFEYFRVPRKYQHRVLFWGILGAVILRGIMIAAGIALIQMFDWIIYVFGALLIFTAVKMLVETEGSIDAEHNFAVQWARKFYPVTKGFEGEKFFTRLDGKKAITPLFLTLIVVETSDILFAIDSIPAILAITQEPFLVFTSNIFAILGLRSMYFALTAAMGKFHHIKSSLVFLLVFIGVKMLISHYYPIPIHVSLAVVGGILAVGVLASIIAPQHKPHS